MKLCPELLSGRAFLCGPESKAMDLSSRFVFAKPVWPDDLLTRASLALRSRVRGSA